MITEDNDKITPLNESVESVESAELANVVAQDDAQDDSENTPAKQVAVTTAQEDITLNPEQLNKLKLIIEALLMAADKPLSVKNIALVLDQFNLDPNTRSKDKIKYNAKYIKQALELLTSDYDSRAIEVKFLGAGYRIQTRPEYALWVQELWQEKPTKYSKATLETLAIIAYRQPITRGEIEHIRGVAVSSQIIRNLLDREWVKVVGHKELPGRPAIYATTQQFLFDLNLEKLEDLPTLADIKEIKHNLMLENYEFGQDPAAVQVELEPEEVEEVEG